MIRRNLKKLEESERYEKATASGVAWRATCRLGLQSSVEERTADQLSVETFHVTCNVCSRKFGWESDKKQHKRRSV